MVETIEETLSLASNSFFDQVRADIASGPMSDEEKKASLSTLARSIEQGDIWRSSIEALSNNEIMALREQVNTLSEVAMVPGPNVMYLTEKFLDLSGQAILMGNQLNTILSKAGHCTSKLNDVHEKMNSYLVSMVESLAAVDEVYNRSLLRLSNHEWATEVWYNLLDGYENLEDLNPEAFQQAFFDLTRSTSPPLSSLGRDFEAPRSSQPSAKILNTALRTVFHEKTQFFICRGKNIYGLTTTAAKDGDMLVFLFPPWYMPMVLRRVEGSDDYHMAGPAILPSAQRIALLRRYKSYGLLQDKSLSTFSII